MMILVKKVFISSKPTFVCLLCPPPCGPFSIQESAAGGLSYKVKKTAFLCKVYKGAAESLLFNRIFAFSLSVLILLPSHTVLCVFLPQFLWDNRYSRYFHKDR